MCLNALVTVLLHSIVTGVRAASPQSKHILCLDDDVILHPSTLQNLVIRLENDPSAFMVTGVYRRGYYACLSGGL